MPATGRGSGGFSSYEGQAGFAHANDIFRDFFKNFGGFDDDPIFANFFGGK